MKHAIISAIAAATIGTAAHAGVMPAALAASINNSCRSQGEFAATIFTAKEVFGTKDMEIFKLAMVEVVAANPDIPLWIKIEHARQTEQAYRNGYSAPTEAEAERTTRESCIVSMTERTRVAIGLD